MCTGGFEFLHHEISNHVLASDLFVTSQIMLLGLPHKICILCAKKFHTFSTESENDPVVKNSEHILHSEAKTFKGRYKENAMQACEFRGGEI